MYDAWLDFHRATLLLKCEGLTPAQLKRSVGTVQPELCSAWCATWPRSSAAGSGG